jgi:ribosome assembly protein YihI (activator of Der GTPase)
MYSLEQTCEIIDRMNELRQQLKISTDLKEQMDLEQTINELDMHLAEN